MHCIRVCGVHWCGVSERSGSAPTRRPLRSICHVARVRSHVSVVYIRPRPTTLSGPVDGLRWGRHRDHKRRRYGTASYLAWFRPGAVRKALLSATRSFKGNTEESRRQHKLPQPEWGRRSCACLASVGPNRPANRQLRRRNDTPTRNGAFCTQVGLCGGVYHVHKHAQHGGVSRRGRGRQPIRQAATSTALSASIFQHARARPTSSSPPTSTSTSDITGWFRDFFVLRYRNHMPDSIPGNMS
jgi:hypothetical protein